MIKELKFRIVAVICGIHLKLPIIFFILILQVEVKICQEKPILGIYGLNYLNIRIVLERKMISLGNAVTVLKTLMFLIWKNRL